MAIILAIFLLLSAFGLYQGLKTVHYSVLSKKIAMPVRFVLLSDLHSQYWGKSQEKILRRVKKAAPDCILLAGDTEDPNGCSDAAPALVKGLSPTPCYYVTGSHDMLTWDMDGVLARMRDAGAIPLQNQTINIMLNENPIILTGVDEPFSAFIQEGLETKPEHRKRYTAQLKAMPPLAKDSFNLLIAHRPEFIETYEEMGFDLVVSGHTHGGQVRVPFILNGLYAPGQGLFPKWAGGLYKRRDCTLIVSRGLHFSFFRPRFFCRPEVVVIDLEKEE